LMHTVVSQFTYTESRIGIFKMLFSGELGVWSDALQCYNDALDDGLTFDSLWVRSLQALQSLAITNDKTVPWPVSMCIYCSMNIFCAVTVKVTDVD